MYSKTLKLVAMTSLAALLTACAQEEPAQLPEPASDDAPEAMTLTEQLDARKARFVEAAPPERVAAAEGAIADVADSGILERAINLGDKAPDFTLPDALGDSVSLYEQLEKGPVILTWYRGSWCPYCNIQLHDYQESLADIHAAGAQLMAVSPELADSALSWKEKEELEFIVYRIPDAISAGYVAGGRNDLTRYNGDDSLELPLAVTYVIGTDGTVEYAFVDADYRKRAETSDVVSFVTGSTN
jgi:peroxiredoxin